MSFRAQFIGERANVIRPMKSSSSSSLLSVDGLTLAVSDYLLWHTLYRYLPHLLVEWIFFFFTAVQLYWLGTKYLLVEFHRKWSSSVRRLSNNEPDIPNLLPDHSIAIVTGHTGIGLSVATELYRRGCTVVITSFGINKDERLKLAHKIRLSRDKETSGGDVHVFNIDLRDLTSVCHFVEQFNEQFKYLNILVNNAGIMYVKQALTVDGFEWHYQINYLSHTLLTWLLLPALKRANNSQPARIVNVSSSTHYARDLFLEDLQSRNSPYSPFHAYAQSKLCVLMFTYYMANWLNDRKEEYNVLVNTCHPGVVNTPLYENVWWIRSFPKVAQLLFRPPEEGAETVLYAALSTQVESSGHYFEDCRQVRSSRFSYRKSIQARLAEITAQQLNPIIDQINSKTCRNQEQIAPMFA